MDMKMASRISILCASDGPQSNSMIPRSAMTTQFFTKHFFAIRQLEQGFNYQLEAGFREPTDATDVAAVLKSVDHQRIDLATSAIAELIFNKIRAAGMGSLEEVRLVRGDGVRVIYRAQP